MTSPFPKDWTLQDAQDWLNARIEEGAHCPCCTQFSKIYYRRINGSMVKALAALYRHRVRYGRDEYRSLPPIDPSHGEAARLGYWNLIEEQNGLRPDGGRNGHWRITDKGENYLRGKFPVPTYARIYDGRLLELTGIKPTKHKSRVPQEWWVYDAVRDKFNLQDLMEGWDGP